MGVLVPFPSVISKKKNVKTLYKCCIIIVLIMKLDDGDKNNVHLWLFLYSFNESTMSTFSVPSIALSAGDTEVSQTDTVPVLMELTAQLGDRLKAAKHINSYSIWQEVL